MIYMYYINTLIIGKNIQCNVWVKRTRIHTPRSKEHPPVVAPLLPPRLIIHLPQVPHSFIRLLHTFLSDTDSWLTYYFMSHTPFSVSNRTEEDWVPTQ